MGGMLRAGRMRALADLVARAATSRRWTRDEWRVRLTQRLHALTERLQLTVGARPGSRRLTPVPADALDAAARAAFEQFRGASTRPRELARQLARRDPEGFAALRIQVARLHSGYASLLGVGEVFVGTPPKWTREPVSGKTTELRHWSGIRHLDTESVGDHKFVWELNRHQYLLAAALIWLVDEDDRAGALVQDHLESWIASNPVKLGINWVSSLEIAYRAISWCWVLWLLRGAPWRGQLLDAVFESLEEHGLHIERYLSTYYSPNTHLTGEALGLVYIGTALPWSDHAARFIARGSEILDQCIEWQVTSDGVYFEQSTQYQRYTTEIYLHHVLLARAAGRPVTSTVSRRLGAMLELLRTTASSSGVGPLLGDDDGGLLLPVDARAPADLRGLLLAGATALGKPELRVPGDAVTGMSYLLCGYDATEAMIQAPLLDPPWTDRHFREGGIAVFRDGWGQSSAVAVIDAAPHGALSCGHSHADALSMTLSLGALPIFVDRGTLTYSGAERNEFRETKSHNTMELDSRSSITAAGPFKWQLVPPAPAGTIAVVDDLKVFQGVATGHADTAHPSRHRRVVLHRTGGAWLVFDHGERCPATTAVARWQLAPGLGAVQTRDAEVSIYGPDGATVARIVAPLSPAILVRPREVSVRYGNRTQALVLEAVADSRLMCIWVLVPGNAEFAGHGELTSPVERSLSTGWSDAAGRNELLVGTRQPAQMQLGDVTLSGDVLWRCTSYGLPGDQSAARETAVAIGSSSDRAECGSEWCDERGLAPVICIRHDSGGTWMRVDRKPPCVGDA